MHALLRRPAVVAVACVLALGCAQKTEVVAAQETFPQNPEGTVRVVAEHLADKHPEILWEAMPESYRADVNDLTAAFAAKMDPEVYDRAMGLGLSFVETLQAKQDIILGSEMVAQTGMEAADLEAKMTAGLVVAQSFFSSEVATIAGLSSIDWQQFLAGTGAELMTQSEAMDLEADEDPLHMLETMEIETIEETDSTATLKVTIEGEDPEEIALVLVEDRWVPKEIADEWTDRVAEAHARLEEITPEQMQEIKGQAMFGLAMGEGFVEQLSAIETSEEFDATMAPMLEGILGNLGNFMAPPEESAEPLDS